jgi:cardiolipin synthase
MMLAALLLQFAPRAAPQPEALPSSVEHIEQLVERSTDAPLYRHNAVRLLLDGPQTFSAMLEAIEAARHHVHLETYIFGADAVGERFAAALIAAARRSVDVRVIYDALGSREAPSEFFARMRDGGVAVHEFNDPLTDAHDVDTRNHRKLLIVDGRVAFTGGINIDRHYAQPSQLTSEQRGKTATGWRDTHLELRGPAVAEFQRLFLGLWEALADPLPEPPFAPSADQLEQGQARVRVLVGVGGNDKASQMRIAFQAAIEGAHERVYITQAYFVPDDELSGALAEAASRGVDVRLLVAGQSDSRFVVDASRSFYSDLLEAGARIYESTEHILHAKTMVVDGAWSTIGSSNFDYWSFLHNHEANAVIIDRGFGERMEEVFLADTGNAVEIELEQWQDRSLWQRTKEVVSRLLRYRL